MNGSDGTGPGSVQGNIGRESRGLIPETLSFVGSLGRHVDALATLSGEEAREELAIYLRVVIMFGAALFFAIFGYTLLFLFIAFSIAVLFHVNWIWILLGLALLHVILAVICALQMKTNWKKPVFSATRAEISQDMENLRGKSPS